MIAGSLIGALAAGMILGTLFFGGLWWTVSRGLDAPVPALWFGLSTLLRMAVTLCGFYYLAHLGWGSVIAGLCGLLIARGTILRLTRTTG